jgi:hypothetical protein
METDLRRRLSTQVVEAKRRQSADSGRPSRRRRRRTEEEIKYDVEGEHLALSSDHPINVVELMDSLDKGHRLSGYRSGSYYV